MIQSLPGYNLYPSSKINLLGSYLNSCWDDVCQINDSSNNIFGAERNRKFVNIQTVGLREARPSVSDCGCWAHTQNLK